MALTDIRVGCMYVYACYYYTGWGAFRTALNPALYTSDVATARCIKTTGAI